LGWGLSSWGFGSALYGMGYMPYANPYYYGGDAAVAGQPVMAGPYDYSQPIDTTSAPADESVANPALALFDAGRASFQQGNYADALRQTNDALAKLPNDTTLHEFRALCLFALGRYDEAAATLYAVLSVGPGWDWTTLIGLYPNVDVYTTQLRALEDYCTTHPESATGRFVLAYQYLTEGHTEAAVGILKQVVALKPSDTLSTKLLRQLDPSQDKPAPATASAPADTAPPQGASIAGTWTARPSADTAIALTVQPGGEFTWKVTRKGQTQQFTGASTYGDGILTLAQDKGPALVGRVSWKDADHMTFRIVGDGPDDPGLNFSK
jgi:tetratricopeptide (TPR) repeat protein